MRGFSSLLFAPSLTATSRVLGPSEGAVSQDGRLGAVGSVSVSASEACVVDSGVCLRRPHCAQRDGGQRSLRFESSGLGLFDAGTFKLTGVLSGLTFSSFCADVCAPSRWMDGGCARSLSSSFGPICDRSQVDPDSRVLLCHAGDRDCLYPCLYSVRNCFYRSKCCFFDSMRLVCFVNKKN